MTKAFFGKVMWVGRATTFCVGLAVVLALVLGAGTTALAAVPGDPFKLGRLNTVDRATALVGRVTGPLFRVDNNGGGPALALEANTGAPPLTVNASAGKAPNLDADRLDGKDASAFLPADGKARDALRADSAGDAGTLDGKDSSDFYAAGSRAADADKLDGLDSEQFVRHPSITSPVRSAADSSRHKVVTASCPPNHLAIGASTRITATSGPGTGSEVPVGLTASGGGYGGWRAEAQEMVPWEGEWYLTVDPICVFAEPEVYAVEGR